MGDAHRSSGHLSQEPRTIDKVPDGHQDPGDGVVAQQEADEDFTLSHRKSADNEAPAAETDHKQAISHRGFGDLSGELRNAIYTLCLSCSDHPIIFYYSGFPVPEESKKYYMMHGEKHLRGKPFNCPAFITGILYVNKATFTEAGAMLYGNELRFERFEVLCRFLDNLSPVTKSWIRNVTLGVGKLVKSTLSPRVFQPLIGLNLQRLCISSSGENNLSDWQYTKLLYVAAFRWLQALGNEKRDMTAGVDIICAEKITDEVGHRWSCSLEKISAMITQRLRDRLKNYLLADMYYEE